MHPFKKRLLSGYAWALTRITAGYLRRFEPTVVVVAGSIGKTSATQAITAVLSERYAVRSTIKSYNVAHSLPLSVFATELPSHKLGWLTLVPRLYLQSLRKQPFDVLVLEIGTDHPGELAQFAYLKPHLGVVTAVTPEHMEYFKTLDAVAAEELSIASFCRETLVNHDMVAPQYRHHLQARHVSYYGKRQSYAVSRHRRHDFQQVASFHLDGLDLPDLPTHFVGTQSLHGMLAAAAVARKLKLTSGQLERGLRNLRPVAGRMRLFKGIDNSTIIDDSYNASPEAVLAALDTLAEVPGTQKIALLGSMNELGETSAEAHRLVGQHCDPAKLDLVVTLGHEATTHLAPVAIANGCTVLTTDSPYRAGELIKQQLRTGATVLVKGSQNRVFAEEAIKALLADCEDADELVRQSPYWLRIKHRQFGA